MSNTPSSAVTAEPFPTNSHSVHTRHPALLAAELHRAQDIQLRVADAITAFAGSMMFLYIHGVIFAVWCSTGLFGSDKYPFGLLTMAVSLEAIFLSTFVMIGQNRQAKFAQIKADHDFNEQEKELHLNTVLTQEIAELVKELHQAGCPKPAAGAAKAPAAAV